jgi:hypothetical protein
LAGCLRRAMGSVIPGGLELPWLLDPAFYKILDSEPATLRSRVLAVAS